MRTAIYIDGFNLYYWLKPLPYRWIDLQALALNAISKPGKAHEIVAVKHYTARVSDTPDDPYKSTRQDIYLRALAASIPLLTTKFGEFRRQPKLMPLANRDGSPGRKVLVLDTEEKGSDVNLAVDLINDAWSDAYDLAIVISNDTDLTHALYIVKRRGRQIGVLVRGDAAKSSLNKVSHFTIQLTEDHLKKSLLPREIPETELRIPDVWATKEDHAGLRPK